jgi:tetrahydromethanopterin S-methyltransferase subunit F
MQVRLQVQSMQTRQSVQTTNSISEEARASNLQQLVLTGCISVSFGLSNIFLMDLSMAGSSLNSSLQIIKVQIWVWASDTREVPLLKIAKASATAIAKERVGVDKKLRIFENCQSHTPSTRFQSALSQSAMAPLFATPASRHLDIPRALFADLKSELLTKRILQSARRTVVASGPDIAKLSTRNLLLRRGLTVNSTQGVTLGVIVAYAVVIALLWNLPYVRWSLWPFKVSAKQRPWIILGALTESL